MSPIHFSMLETALKSEGVDVEILGGESKETIEIGLKYVNNDACFPAIIVVGQFIEALKSGKYDLNSTCLVMSQTGGMCRASNYIGFIKTALKKAGFESVPVISVNVSGIKGELGISLSPVMLIKAMQAIIYGDLFMRLLYRTRPYEIESGSANALHKDLEAMCMKSLAKKGSRKRDFVKNVEEIVRQFDNLPINLCKKPRVGVVGEILVKFMPLANNNLVELLESEGAEAVVPDLLDFFLYSLYNSKFKHQFLGKSLLTRIGAGLAIRYIENYRNPVRRALEKSERFESFGRISKIADMAKDYISLGNQAGEGWLLTGEMLELIHSGADNIVCAQPFACLPNHIVGKGVMKVIKEKSPLSNIIAIDYDPGASEVNQLNRIKLMLETARKKSKEVSQIKYINRDYAERIKDSV